MDVEIFLQKFTVKMFGSNYFSIFFLVACLGGLIAILPISLPSLTEPAIKFTDQAVLRNANSSEIPNALLASDNNAYAESIEETIMRIKRNVVVTGIITGSLGEKSALFQIEGMPDRLFNINTQLMDGFIIKEITSKYVLLKNQQGEETFFLYVNQT